MLCFFSVNTHFFYTNFRAPETYFGQVRTYVGWATFDRFVSIWIQESSVAYSGKLLITANANGIHQTVHLFRIKAGIVWIDVK